VGVVLIRPDRMLIGAAPEHSTPTETSPEVIDSMTNAKEAVEALTEIAGAGNVLARPSDIAPHLIDWRKRHIGQALCVVFPRSVEHVSRVVGYCSEHRIPVFPQGGNTSTCGGSVPDESGNGIVLNLARMNRVIDVNAADNSITVEAGCILAHIQEAALEADRVFPLTLGAEGSCQIGGNIATNAGGTNVLRFGNTRDLVLGLQVVLPDGTIWNGLRTLRKNNSGYDLKHLFVGSEGTLGIVTAASLKLFPNPRARATALLGFGNVDAAVREGLRLQTAFPGELVGLELISRREFEISLRHAARARNPFDVTPDWLVLVELAEYSGNSEELTTILTHTLGESLENGAIDDAVIASSEQQRADLWNIRHSVTEGNVREGMGLTHDIAVPIYRIPDFIAAAEATLAAHFPDALPVVVGHMGDGNIHYITMFSHAFWAGLQVEEKVSLQQRVARELYDIAVGMDGTFSAEHGIGSLHVHEMALYKNEEELAMMRQIKRLLDPRGIMNPGRVLPE
jgi:FAD/FMN-containing dehydrogenase